jgi:hypothetical protein
MKAADRKPHVTRMLVACFALLLMFAHDASAQGKSPAPCRDGQLSARKVNEDAAMGGARMNEYALTNTSPAPCTLKGYPRFEVLGASGRVVRRGCPAAGGDAEQHPDVLTVGAGKEATFSVSYNAGGAGRVGKPCPNYPGVRITAPGGRRGLALRDGLQLCGELEVSPVGPPSGEQPPE